MTPVIWFQVLIPVVIVLLAMPCAAAENSGSAPAERQMPAELQTLWDMRDISKTQLDVEVISSRVEDGYRVEEIYFTSEQTPNGPNRVFCGVGRPESPARLLPVLLELHGGGGHGSAERALLPARDTNAMAISMDWGGVEPPGPKHFTEWSYPPPGKENILGRDTPAHRVVIAARRAIDFASQQPYVDMSKVVCYGGSWGGYYSLLVPGTDPRVTDLVTSADAGGWQDSYSLVAHGIQSLSADQRARWLATYDPLAYAQYTKADVSMIMFTNDDYFWYGSVQRNYLALSSLVGQVPTPILSLCGSGQGAC